MADQFDWRGTQVAVKQVDAIAVLVNDEGDLEIRQRNTLGEDDAVIVFPMSQAKAVIDAIKAATK